MTTTSNHNWDIPDVGGSKDTWGQILNDLFENDLDRQVTLEDTVANRPTADGTAVKYFHATDEGRLYYNDGSSWNILAENVADLADDPHDLGGSQHGSDTLANLNSKVSDATLDDSSDSRPPDSHSGSHESGGTDEIDSGNLPANSEFQIYTTTSDPSSASVGSIWYRSDLD